MSTVELIGLAFSLIVGVGTVALLWWTNGPEREWEDRMNRRRRKR